MTKKKSSGNMLWAIDPFLKDRGVNENATEWMQKLGIFNDINLVQAVYVVNPDQMYLPPSDFPGFVEDWISEYFPYTQKKMAAELKQLNRSDVSSKILLNSASSLSSAAETLAKYAGDQDSDIVVTRSARSKIAKQFLGSFTETLLDVARDSNFIVLPNAKPAKKVKISNIMMPTLFSKSSENRLEEVFRICKKFDAELLFFYQEASSQVFRSFRVPRNAEVASRAALSDAADSFVAKARIAGVKASVRHIKSDASVSESIVKVAGENHCGAIVMVPERAGISKHLGSVVKKTVSMSKVPVFLISSR